LAVVAQLVDDVLDGAVHRAERDDDGLRVLGAVAADEAARVAAEHLPELLESCGISSSARICLWWAR
jgi:hypothetical protein